jgi:hypothetical protein
MKHIGIDYHKRYSVACIVAEAGTPVVQDRIEHTFPERFGQLIGSHAPCQAAFEARERSMGRTRMPTRIAQIFNSSKS